MTTFCKTTTKKFARRYEDYAEGKLVNVEFVDGDSIEAAMLLFFEGYELPVRKPARWVPDFDLDDESYYVATWQPQVARDSAGQLVNRRRFVFLRLGDYETIAAQVAREQQDEQA